MTKEEKIKGLYKLKQHLMNNSIELCGHKSLPITLIDYSIETLEQEPKTGRWIHFALGDDCSECGWCEWWKRTCRLLP